MRGTLAPWSPRRWFAAVALLAWALRARLRGERSCPTTITVPGQETLHA